MATIRPCRDDERPAILAVVNAAAEAYRGVIPADRWHEPYMPPAELDEEIAAGVVFWAHERDGALVGVMGIQQVRDVDLIRHAYVDPRAQRRGVGGALLEHLVAAATRPLLVGTWAAAGWAVDFYRRHGFEQVSPARKSELLRTYWTIPERQIEASVVLERRPVTPAASRTSGARTARR
jgi:GNAT superfamily N-acetyltransferase